MRLLFAAMVGLALTGCQTSGTITEKQFVEVKVPVRAACPDPETMAAVNKARPVPLRDQEMPATEQAQQAAVRAQLGRYEARNAWADQAQAVMDRCFRQGVDTATTLESEG